MDAFTHLTDFILGQSMELNDALGERTMHVIRTVFLENGKGLKKLCSLQKTARAFEKNQEDAIRIENMAPVSTVKDAVFQAMLDLQLLLDHSTLMSESIPAAVLRASECILVGTLFLNGYAGRPKAWHAMTVEHVWCPLRSLM